MKISGKINVFKNVREVEYNGEKKSYVTYNAHESRKEADGSYSHMPVRVKFTGEKFTKDKLDKLKENVCYTISVTDGFTSFEWYNSKDNVVYIPVFVITDAKIESQKEVNKNDNPF